MPLEYIWRNPRVSVYTKMTFSRFHTEKYSGEQSFHFFSQHVIFFMESYYRKSFGYCSASFTRLTKFSSIFSLNLWQKIISVPLEASTLTHKLQTSICCNLFEVNRFRNHMTLSLSTFAFFCKNRNLLFLKIRWYHVILKKNIFCGKWSICSAFIKNFFKSYAVCSSRNESDVTECVSVENVFKILVSLQKRIFLF